MDSINNIVKKLRESRISEARASYEEMKDVDLVKLVQEGDQYAFEVLLSKYKYFIHKMTKKYVMDTQDPDDIIQIAQIGFWDAVNSWNLKGEFEPYAGMIVKRKLIDELRKDSTEKNKLNTKASSLDEPVGGDEDGESSVGDTIPASGLSTAEDLEGREGERELIAFMKEKLSDKELKVINLYIKGYKISDILEEFDDMKYKQVENTLMRVKNKLSAYLRDKGKFKESTKPRMDEDSFFSPEEKAVLVRVMKEIDEESGLAESVHEEETTMDHLSKLESDIEDARGIIQDTTKEEDYQEALNRLDSIEDELWDILDNTEDSDEVQYSKELLDKAFYAKETEAENLKVDPYADRGLRRSDFH